MKVKTNCINDIRKAALFDKNLNEEFYLDFQDFQIKVRSNSGNLIDALKNYYSEFLTEENEPVITINAVESKPPVFKEKFTIKQPDFGKNRVKEEYFDLTDGRIVRKVLTGMVFIFGRGINSAIGPCLENYNQVINFINNRYIEWLLKRDSLLFHASGVVLNNHGIIISGFSGTGKSTLALQLMSKGASFLSNDRVLLKNENSMPKIYGVPKLPRINPGTILHNPDLLPILTEKEHKELIKLSPEELWELEDKYDACIDELFGKGKFILASKMSALVILNWEKNGKEIKIEKIDLNYRKELFPAFTKSPGLFFLQDNSEKRYNLSNEDYLNALADYPVFEISGGVDFEYASDFMFQFLEENNQGK